MRNNKLGRRLARPTFWSSLTSLLLTWALNYSLSTLPCRALLDACVLKFDTEVLLLYWPPNATTATTSEPLVTFVTSAITFKGQDMYYIGYENTYEKEFYATDSIDYVYPSVLRGPFTFTSPMVYIAHKPISARRWGTFQFSTKIGSTWLQIRKNWVPTIRTAGTMEIHSSDVFSLRPGHGTVDGAEYVKRVVQGRFQMELPEWDEKHHQFNNWDILQETQPFNFKDLDYPVPASAYFDARSRDCWGDQSHCQTITDDNYRPHLQLHSSIWPALFQSALKITHCAVPDLVDPPIVLGSIQLDASAMRPTITRPSLQKPYNPTNKVAPGSLPTAPYPKQTARRKPQLYVPERSQSLSLAQETLGGHVRGYVPTSLKESKGRGPKQSKESNPELYTGGATDRNSYGQGIGWRALGAFLVFIFAA